MNCSANQSILPLSRADFFFSDSMDAGTVVPPPPSVAVAHDRWKRWGIVLAFLMTGALLYQDGFAQTADGNNGLSQANTMVRSYFDIGTQLLYGVGALVGLFGAFKVYRSLDSNDGHAREHIAVWFGACLFLVMAATVLKSFFGV
jgi:hypothetical protein